MARGSALVVAAFLVITGVTGLAGPGPLRRYPVAELQELVDAIHQDAGDLRTPEDCWRLLADDPGPRTEVARVDLLGSRVVVRAWAGDDGLVDDETRRLVERRLDEVLDEHAGLHAGMLRVEAGVDGWQPGLDCGQVATRPVTGF